MPSSGAQGYGPKCHECSTHENMDGPQPMRDCKPSKINPNSVDKFRQSHQAEYEARGKRSTENVERVERHNAAYPVLKDEIDRRRSTTRLTVLKVRRGTNTHSVCSVCLKLKRRKMRKNILRPKRQSRRRQRKIKEKQYRSSRCIGEIYGGQRRAGNKYIRASSSREGVTSPRDGSVSTNGHKSGSDVASLKNPSTAEPSVSSYHSYPSLDHEPMVS